MSGGLRDVRHLLHGIIDGRGDPPQVIEIVAAAMEGQGEHRHVIDTAGLQQRRGCARGDAVKVGIELLVKLDYGLLLVPANEETHDRERLARTGRGVDVLDPRNLPRQLLQRPGDPLLDLLRRGARHLHEDVDHRHDDLRLLLAGQQDDREGAEKHGAHGEQGSKRRIDEEIKDLRDDPEATHAVSAFDCHRGIALGLVPGHCRGIAFPRCRSKIPLNISAC